MEDRWWTGGAVANVWICSSVFKDVEYKICEGCEQGNATRVPSQGVCKITCN